MKRQKKQWLEILTKEFSFKGYIVDRINFGEIDIEKDEINEGLNYADSDAENAAFYAIHRVLKRGIIIGNHNDHKDRGYSTITIAAPV